MSDSDSAGESAPAARAEPAESAAPAGWRRFRIDISPLRTSPSFRRLYFGSFISFAGSMVTYVALPFQVKELTDSFVAVGLIGLFALVPMIIGGLWGGAIADAFEKKRILLACEAVQLVIGAVLLVNALLPNPSLWLIYACAMLFAGADSLQRPSSESMLARVVPHDQLPAASGLQSLKMTGGSIAGPAIGGIILATWGTSWAYGVDVVSYVISILFYLGLKKVLPAHDAEAPSLRAIGDGIKYAWQRKDLLGTYAVDFAAMVLAFPTAMFPFVAESLDAPWVLGWLYAAGSIGGLIAALTSGWVSHVHHHGRGVLIAAIFWGLAIGFFGLATNVWLVLVLLALAGAADMVSVMFRLTIWNQTIPDEYRGRLAGIEVLSFTAGPQLGQIRSGLLAQATSLRFSLASGGFASAAFAAVIGLLIPSLWRYDARTDVHAVAQRQARAAEAAGGAH